MFKTPTLLLGGAIAAGLLTLVGTSLTPEADAAANGGARRFQVTITNVTRGQIFSPTLIATHNDKFSLFELGAPASPGLALMAEDGDNSMMAASLMANGDVRDVRSTAGVLMPGESTTMSVVGDASHPYLTVGNMLVSTNDAFMSVRGLRVPFTGDFAVARGLAYDAGSEANSEDCAYIPGPPCGNGGVHDPAPAEGYVHVHAGIHGIGSLNAAERDWRGPVAEVRVRLMP